MESEHEDDILRCFLKLHFTYIWFKNACYIFPCGGVKIIYKTVCVSLRTDSLSKDISP